MNVRHIFFDTETTGFDPDQGDRLVELAAVEYINAQFTGRIFHELINPERDVPAATTAIHGHTTESLRNKPVFSQIADSFIDFVSGGEMFAHNADFDSRFLVSELKRAGSAHSLLDVVADIQNTVTIFRKLNPGERSYSLDNVRLRLKLSNEEREVKGHGALLDSHLLAEAFYAMQRWVPTKDGTLLVREEHQRIFDYSSLAPRSPVHRLVADPARPLVRAGLNADEFAAHCDYVKGFHPDAVLTAPATLVSPSPVAAPATSRFTMRR